jgi:ATP-dependent exoDNAse (exonuclease V) beta subunit
MVDPSSSEAYTVVWWDPALIDRPGEDTRGLRRDDLISKDARPEDVAADRARYLKWQADRAATHARASTPSLPIVTATDYTRDAGPDAEGVVVIDASGVGPRPSGRRFGILVHAMLAHVPFDAKSDDVRNLAALHARVLGAPDEERDAAAAIIERVLGHAVLQDARNAVRDGRACWREAPITFMREGVLIDGQIDLAYERAGGWLVVDFKTNAELGTNEAAYRRQVALYAEALAGITGTPASAAIVRV